MRPIEIILWVLIVFVVCLAFGAWSTYDYGLQCTKCLAGKHVVEQQLFGLTVLRGTEDRERAADYERIFGRPCEHVFRKGGFGRGSHSLLGSSIGCGITGEGVLVRPRLEAVFAAYDIERRLIDPELTLATFDLIDTLMPPDISIDQRHAVPDTAQSKSFLISLYLRRANAVEEWRAVLHAARGDFSDRSNLPTR